MIIEMLAWGFFTAWGWFGANYVKEQIWPPEPTAVEIKVKDSNEQSNKQSQTAK